MREATEAEKKINELIKKAQDALNEATKIADQSGEGFYWSAAEGMGGYYSPAPVEMTKQDVENALEDKSISEYFRNTYKQMLNHFEEYPETDVLFFNRDENDWSESSYEDYGWNSSSSNC